MRMGWSRIAGSTLAALAACGGGEHFASPVKLEAPPAMPTNDIQRTATQHPKLTYHGGQLLAKPDYTNVYWGSYWQSGVGRDDASYYDSFMSTMAGSARFMSVTQEYSRADQPIGTGAFHGSIRVAGEPGDQIDDLQIRELLRAQIAAGALPQPSSDQVYVVYLPPGTAVIAGGDKSCEKFCGYHWTFFSSQLQREVPYIVLPHPDCWGCRFAVLHDVSLTDVEIRDILGEALGQVGVAILSAIEHVPPELLGDIKDRGIVLTGGVSQLRNIEERFRGVTGLPVSVADNPFNNVLLGTAKLLRDPKMLARLSIREELTLKRAA